MRHRLHARTACLFALAFFTVFAQAHGATSGDPNAGAQLVQAHGCAGCHGANFTGGPVGPSLYGIEHRLTDPQIAGFIARPRSPMPNYGLSDAQIRDVVAYLDSLDGGAHAALPVVQLDPNPPARTSTIAVRFTGTPPQNVSVLPMMQMGEKMMHVRPFMLHVSANDPHLFTGTIHFSMSGPWTLHIRYDTRTMVVPVTVGG